MKHTLEQVYTREARKRALRPAAEQRILRGSDQGDRLAGEPVRGGRRRRHDLPDQPNRVSQERPFCLVRFAQFWRMILGGFTIQNKWISVQHRGNMHITKAASRFPSHNYTPAPSGHGRRKEPHMTNLTIGQQVTNFGITATVVDFHNITGDPILWAPGVGKWLADTAKCEPAAEPAYWQHKDGLVAIG